MFDISPIQILIVLVIALVVFGPRRLPQMAREAGKGLREFKQGITSDAPAPAAPAERSPGLPSPAADDDPQDDLDGLVLPGDQRPDTPRD